VSRPALGLTQPPVQWVPGVLFGGVKRCRGVMLTTHPHLVPRLRMIGAIPPLPPGAFLACIGTPNKKNYSSICTHVSRSAGLSSSCIAIHPLHFSAVTDALVRSCAWLLYILDGNVLPLKKPDLHLEHVAALCCKQTLPAVRIYQQSGCYFVWLPYKLFAGLFLREFDRFQHNEDRGVSRLSVVFLVWALYYQLSV
jgi:hypothetical protein